MRSVGEVEALRNERAIAVQDVQHASEQDGQALTKLLSSLRSLVRVQEAF
jgi:LAS superfamily LD-carboxypeptidase LdcB